MKFSDILQDHRIPYLEEGHHHCRPGWIQIDCPHCGKSSGKYHMGYNIAGGYVHCWKCGRHPLTGTLAELLDIGIKEARKLLKGVARDGEVISRKPRGKLVLPEGLGPLLPQHEKYIRSRGFDPAEVQGRWKVQGIGLAVKLKWRIWIPIELDAEVVSWTTRSISDAVSLRYISASSEQEAYPHKDLLYGEDYCRMGCVLVEGPLDAWAIGPGAAATCGTAFSLAQMARFARFPRRAICFDSEPEAQKRARGILEQMSVFPGETLNFVLEDGKDPASTSKRELRQLRKTMGYE